MIMRSARLAISATGLLVAATFIAGCKKKEEPVPMPEPAPPPPAVTVAPEKPAEPEPEPAASAAGPIPTPVPASPRVVASPHTAAPAPSTSAAAASKGPGPLGSCCSALAAEAKKGGPTQNQYTSAAQVCSGIDQHVKLGHANLASAKVTLKAQLAGVAVPAACN